MATIAEIITQVDALKPNQFTAIQKIQWLSECESMVHVDVIARHAGNTGVFPGFDETVDPDTILSAQAPHDALYRHYLTAQIDLANQELLRYNNSSQLFNNAYQAFKAWYTRNHMPAAEVDHFTI